MEATALVLDDGATRIVLVGADLVGASGAWAKTIRDQIGAAVGAPPHHVLLNSQHTHAAPPTPGWAKIEPVVVQRHVGRPAPFAPKAGEQLIRHSLELTDELFDPSTSER